MTYIVSLSQSNKPVNMLAERKTSRDDFETVDCIWLDSVHQLVRRHV